MRYLVTLSYDGSNYNGFQRLKDLPSIQSELESALSIINKNSVIVKGSGRTDKGVHALGQVVHFDLDYDIPSSRLINAMNSLLPNDIRVLKCNKVNNDIHARFSVKRKIYKYIINLGEYDLFKDKYLYNYCKKLDISKIRKACHYLLGKHSYKAFVSGYRENYNSEIYNVKINKKRDILAITFVGKSFYRYMIRNLVGALIYVGENKITIDEFKNMIDGDNNYSYLTVPSNGLYLESVDY